MRGDFLQPLIDHNEKKNSGKWQTLVALENIGVKVLGY